MSARGTRRTGLRPYADAAAPLGGCCVACYSAHERFGYPFVVYCPHRGRVVRVLAPSRWWTWPLTADDLIALVEEETS